MKKFVFVFIIFHITLTLAGQSDNETFDNNSAIRQRRSPAGAAGPGGGTSLLNEPECQDLHKFCANDDADDLSILECIQTLQSSQLESLSEGCQHLIWRHTRNILADDAVAQIIHKPCNKEADKLTECRPAAKSSQSSTAGGYLACLVDRTEDNKLAASCQNMIRRLESIAFTDFRFLGKFMEDCDDDVERLSCGRLNADRERVSQGETVACLQEKVDELKPNCRKQVLHVSEQQSQDLKMDRKFFVSCKTDSIHFCPNIAAGTNAVFKCLVKQKDNADMSAKCREQIVRRDKLVARDYRVSRGLARSCHEDIRVNHCRRGVSNDKIVRLAQILLCLESVAKNGTKLSNECHAEITDHRQMLMTDHQLSPEILNGCKDDIPKFCNEVEFPNNAKGEIIHCLMDHARAKRRRDRRVTSTCQRALEDLIKLSDVGEDWRVDPVLRRACQPVVDVACRNTDGGDARVMSCLMEQIGTSFMTSQCESALMLIQYFVARDFKLDPQLYRNCRDDAIHYCKAKKAWDDANNGQMDPERGPLVLPCLHRIAYSENKSEMLKKECFQELKRVMRQRAISVDLIPEVEDHCISDLSMYCADKTGKSTEMQCLQDNLEKLSADCKDAVSKYTEEEAGHIELNPIIMSVCRSAMDKYCSDVYKKTKEEGDMMDCLISHKNDPDLRQDLKCRAAIEHFQIISLKNYHFTYKFKESCRPYVIRFCKASTTKYDVVACLSEVMRNNTIRGERHSIPKECRQQVKAQLYQQRENINFDPKLKNACKNEIKEHCVDMPQDGGQVNAKNILECLQTKTNFLGESCRHALFNVRRSELDDSSTDYTLMNTCRDMIVKFCRNKEPSTILNCLKMYKNDPLFDSKCHLVVVNRMIEQNLDFRFNTALQTACGKNIAQYCSHIVATAKPDEELNGKMVNCLKNKFRESKLDHDCEKQMIVVLSEQALNYKLNPLLKSLCEFEIKACHTMSFDEIDDDGKVEECLKNAFLNQQIFNKACRIEVATLIQEAKADIHVDPLLQRACTTDLLRYCPNVRSGNGRQLQCLQVILKDKPEAMESECREKIVKRMEMFQNAESLLAQPPESMVQLISQVTTSPSKKYFLVVLMSFVGVIFIFGMFCGRATKRTMLNKMK